MFSIVLKTLILSLIPFNPWMFLLCVLDYLSGSQTAVSDITSWHGFAFHLNVAFFKFLHRGLNTMNIRVKFMA